MKKTDVQLQQDVVQELNYEPSINASETGVSAKDGIVGLTGNVQNFVEKYAAVHAAERVSGVTAVTDELNVDVPELPVLNDEDIARAAINALEWHVWIPTQIIKVKVENGWITLEGEVDYKYEQTAAEEAVRNLIGVTGVINLITLKRPAVLPPEVKTTIEQALRRAAKVAPDCIKVSVVSDTVILDGKVCPGQNARRPNAQPGQVPE